MIRLADSEWKIASLLWDNGPMTITEITKALSTDTGWIKNTIITLLKRMEEKGAVGFDQNGRAKSFFMLIDRTETELSETSEFLDKIYKGNLGLMISNMVKADKITPDEIDELMKILEDNK